jgi:phage terminase Nu1 subunit (DNA packaging protein)
MAWMKLLATSDVARMAGVSADAVRLWARSGMLRAHHTAGGMRLFDEALVLRFLAKRARRRAPRAQQRSTPGRRSRASTKVPAAQAPRAERERQPESASHA